jgi:hypothetical protein
MSNKFSANETVDEAKKETNAKEADDQASISICTLKFEFITKTSI